MRNLDPISIRAVICWQALLKTEKRSGSFLRIKASRRRVAE